jgi:ribosomal-protein-alanine N-acetyltransferase
MSLLEWISPETGPSLQGQGVVLRPPRRRDYPQWETLRQGSRSFLQPWEPVWSPDELSPAAYARRLSAWRNGRESDQMYAFFVFRESDDALVGGITLNNVRRGVAQMGTVGYWSGQPYARQGHTLAALRTLIGFAFGPLGPAPPRSRLPADQRRLGGAAAESRLHRGRLCEGLSEN